MFELVQSISIDVGNGVAEGEATVQGDHPLFADHFPCVTVLPGSLLIELAAQIAGPLCEEVTSSRLKIERWAVLGMIRDAKFLQPVALPATVNLKAEVRRAEASTTALHVEGHVHKELVMTAELVMMMIEAAPEWADALRARNERIASWKNS